MELIVYFKIIYTIMESAPRTQKEVIIWCHFHDFFNCFLARANALDDLNRMPLRANTIRVRTMRSELENRLSELESAINIFTKPVVYVKLD